MVIKSLSLPGSCHTAAAVAGDTCKAGQVGCCAPLHGVANLPCCQLLLLLLLLAMPLICSLIATHWLLSRMQPT